jgi:hypothetical protein
MARRVRTDTAKTKPARPVRRRRALGQAAGLHVKRVLDLPAPPEARRDPPPEPGEPG